MAGRESRRPDHSEATKTPGLIPSSVVADVIRNPGRAVDPRTRVAAERRFGRDFSHVRVHADDRAAASAAELHARAYTIGSHVVFGRGGIEPGVLAHELVHVAQQSRAAAADASLPLRLQVDPVGAAEHQASAASPGAPIRVPVAVQRQALPSGASRAHEAGGPLPAIGADDGYLHFK